MVTIARVQRSLVRMQPLVFREKRRVNVDDTARPLFNKTCAEYAHETRAANEFDPCFSQYSVQCGFKVYAFFKGFMINRHGLNVQLSGFL